ncbi:glycosyltransferase [bacterium]|nr:glycosyltransferase [bacterium]
MTHTASALADHGHSVYLWVARPPASVNVLEQYLGRDLPERLRLVLFHPKGTPGRKKTPFSGFWASGWNVAWGLLRWGRPDVVLSRSPLVLAQLRGHPLFSGKTPLVLEYQYPEWAQQWRKWRASRPDARLVQSVERLRRLRESERDWLRAADGVLCASEGGKRELWQDGYGGPVSSLPSGCWNPEVAPPSEPARFALGYHGQISPENGIETLLHATALLRDESGSGAPNLRLIGGGDFCYTEHLKRLARDLGIEKDVVFEGAVAFSQTRPLLRECRVGVVPISARRGPEKRQWASPLKLVEWMAAGVPVVASGVPSVAQHVAHRREILLARPDDAEDIARVIRLLLNDEVCRGDLARAGLAYARSHSHEKRAERILEFFESLLKDKP